MSLLEIKRGDFVTYYEPVVKSSCVINVQDWHWDTSKILDGHQKYKKWIYYKAFNLSRKHMYHDGSRMAIILEEYTQVRLSTPGEIDLYMKALKEEGLTL